MRPTAPLPLYHSWPLGESARQFALGGTFQSAASEFAAARAGPELAPDIGRWSCDLADNALTWSGEVYDVFGLPRGAQVSRDETLAFYCDGSRDIMQRLRSYAIKHRRGFTLDAEIRTVSEGIAWMRLIAAPVCEGGRVVRLEGVKQRL